MTGDQPLWASRLGVTIISVMRVWRRGLERGRCRLGQVGGMEASPGSIEGGIS